MSLLAAFPLFYVYGVSSQIWQEIAGGMLPFDEVWGASVGCLLGAWLGAIPIPLDWCVVCRRRLRGFELTGGRDRDWQTWPITIVAGAYAGYAAGKPAGGYLLRGKRIRFDDEGSMDSSRD
jgi:phosphatidylinositol glycan class F